MSRAVNLNNESRIVVFGEVLFDCFPTGEHILGGAPFNVAWHLQALGDQPMLISRVGDDSLGEKIINAMQDWQIDTSNIQLDNQHPTGRVNVNIVDNEPNYDIIKDCAYDFITTDKTVFSSGGNMLYHGSLAIRHQASRQALMALANKHNMSIFLDVNLRPPWWEKDQIIALLENATWVKLNEDELVQLGFSEHNLEQAITNLQSKFELQQVILTRGKDGAIVCTKEREFHYIKPEPVVEFVDTVGAGDAFTAVYIHGLLSGWSIPNTLKVAQQFASKVVGLRGATTIDPTFYTGFTS